MKLELFCSKDGLRPTMMHVKVTPTICVATDAHILGVVPTSNVFNTGYKNDEFLENIPEEGILIHKDDWKELMKYEIFTWKSEGIIKTIATKSRQRDKLFEVHTENKVGKYPDWKAVIPERDMNKLVEVIGIDAEKLATIQKAFGWYFTKLTFNGTSEAIYLEGINDESGAYAIIMPCLIK